MIDIVLIACNRLAFLKKNIEYINKRIKTPHRIIVVDNNSIREVGAYLDSAIEDDSVFGVLHNSKSENLCECYNRALKYVKSDIFITTQDDLLVPRLEPDVIQQLIKLLKRDSEIGSVSCRIQRIPNIDKWDEELVPARKSFAAYFRIHRLADIKQMGGFGDRKWDAGEFNKRMESIGKKCYWARDLWCNHLGYCENRGYPKWFVEQESFPYQRKQDYIRRPYPKIDSKTNKPV